MIQNPERMEYRWGTIKKAMRPEDLPAGVWCEADIPAHLRAAINAEDLFDLGGVHGDKTAGYPVEYDNLELLMTEDTVEITVYDRGIALFMSDDERIRPIHRVLWELGATRNDRWPVQRQAWRRRHGQAALWQSSRASGFYGLSTSGLTATWNARSASTEPAVGRPVNF